ncbi:MAG TPA: hypothetical protein VKV15_23510 [Bryobacteraceae bacterium]|nr:hypothetical protein [Bryobacteraceae bacterium]
MRAEESARLLVRLQDENGAPRAARIDPGDSSGHAHTPKGNIAREIARSREPYFHASGQFQVRMPAGAASAEALS